MRILASMFPCICLLTPPVRLQLFRWPFGGSAAVATVFTHPAQLAELFCRVALLYLVFNLERSLFVSVVKQKSRLLARVRSDGHH